MIISFLISAPEPNPDSLNTSVLDLTDRDPFVRAAGPNPAPSINISTVLWFPYDFLPLKNNVNVPSKRNRHKNLASWRSLTKWAGSEAWSCSQRYGSADPDSFQSFLFYFASSPASVYQLVQHLHKHSRTVIVQCPQHNCLLTVFV